MNNVFERAGDAIEHPQDGTIGYGTQARLKPSIRVSTKANEETTSSGGRDLFSDDDSLKLWWRSVQQYPLLSRERELELAARIREENCSSAFEELVESNLRLVANIARKCQHFAGPTLSLSDLVQEGSIGLIRAAHKYDHRKGYRFSTYATYWIRQAILRAIADQGRTIRLPVHVVETLSRTERARIELMHKMHRNPSKSELAAYLAVPEKKIIELLTRSGEMLSLDTPLTEDDDYQLKDVVEDFEAESPLETVACAALYEEVTRAVARLPRKEARILRLRYGMNKKGKHHTLDEVGKITKLSRERIRQLERAAISKLRRQDPLKETLLHALQTSYCGHTQAVA